MRSKGRRACALFALLLGAALSLLLCASPALASGWAVEARTMPTNVPPGGRSMIELDLLPLGAALPEGPVTVTDTLPSGLKAIAAGEALGGNKTSTGTGGWTIANRLVTCGTNAAVVTCTMEPSFGLPWWEGPIVNLGVLVEALPGASGTVVNHVTVTGGGAPEPARASEPITISSASPGFGLSQWDVIASNANGTIDDQAGTHPYEMTFVVGLNTTVNQKGFEADPVGEAREITVNLPVGLVGNPATTVRCTQAQFEATSGFGTDCPEASQIGTVRILVAGVLTGAEPVYNMLPPPGAPAEFGFQTYGNPTLLISGPRTGADNGITTHIHDIAQSRAFSQSILTLWGDPADPRHDLERGKCLEENFGFKYEIKSPEASCQLSESGVPLFTLPTQCGTPPAFSIHSVAWGGVGAATAEANVPWHDSEGGPVGITDCEPLHFEPSLALAPDTSFADVPAGLTAEVTPSIGGLLEPEGVSTAEVQNTTVALPPGIVINPGQATGLKACPEGPASSEPGGERYGDNLPLAGENGYEERFEGPARCPAASKVGTVEITTPLLADKLQGEVFVLPANPPHLRLLVAASAEGVYLKLIGLVSLCESAGETIDGKACMAPGQLITKFEDTPQLPFTDFKLSFSGGAQAALATPTKCGTYTSGADFGPWSGPFVADAIEESSFAISSGPGGSACPSSPLPFHPELIAGSTTDQAGGFTDFSLLLQRGDGQQRIDGLQFKAPEGLTGLLSKVPLCTNAQAEAGECPEASKIGHTVVESGPGPYPLVVPEPGQSPAPIYLTEGYKGAPFGLAIVVPLHVGPFVLPTQQVRAKIEVDPITSALTVTTDPLPQEVAGVPTDLREVDAVIERPGFMINPTDCAAQEFSGTAYGAAAAGEGEGGESAAIGSHFQMGSCRSLAFHPRLATSTSSRSSRANGTSVSFDLSYPKDAIGKEAWLKALKVDLPKQLPSRLTTLQKSCPVRTFDANPAVCSSGSRIGTARVRTELLPVPLEGPVYFVSNGGAKFPEAVFALQGDGVTIDIHAETFINEKTGVTSATFRAIPDDPFEEAAVTLPSGPYSEFTANGNLCKGQLKMPTAFVGQNGAEVHQSTPVKVTGCPKVKKAKHHAGKSKKSKKRRRK